MELEELRHELKLVSNAAKHGSHVEVAENIGISVVYLGQIRSGKNLTVNSSENRETIKNIISEYRKIIRRQQQELANI